jgi:poly(3-hydroxybutyrate) depolymerase
MPADPPAEPPGAPRGWWARIRAFFARLRARLFRRERGPGYFETGRVSSWRGFLTTAPLVPSERDYLIYVPRGWSRWRRAALVVLCHGCRQTPEEIAGVTAIAERADREGWLVLMPRQTERANAWRCWNWFESNTVHGGGEAAIVAAQIVDARRRYRARRERVWVLGLSAGGAIAAVLGLRFPRLVRGVVAHSGLACGAASTPAAALAVMQHGPDNDVALVADKARLVKRDISQPVPLLVIQGERDDVVGAANGIALVEQYLRFNAHPAGISGYAPAAPLPASDSYARESTRGRRAMRTNDWRQDGRVVVRHVVVEGLAHAWSGGDGRYAYADPNGPDALELFVRFAAETSGRR